MISSTITWVELVPTVIAFVSLCIGMLGAWVAFEDLSFLRAVGTVGSRLLLSRAKLYDILLRVLIKLTLIFNGVYQMTLPPTNPNLPITPQLVGYSVVSAIVALALATGTLLELRTNAGLLGEMKRVPANGDRRGAMRREDDVSWHEAATAIVRKVVREELASVFHPRQEEP